MKSGDRRQVTWLVGLWKADVDCKIVQKTPLAACGTGSDHLSSHDLIALSDASLLTWSGSRLRNVKTNIKLSAQMHPQTPAYP